MEFKGTKGKWVIIEEENNISIETNDGVDNWDILNTITKYPQDKANALLISKAPEMLQMLEKILYTSEEKGRANCTYGDTEMSSLDVCFGYNLALEHVKQGIEKLIEEATKID